MTKDLIVNCPTCKKSVAWRDNNEYKPFCGKRCRLIDLGEWASENHRIAGKEMPQELVDELKKYQD